jgi:hypothetical protein
MGGIFFPFLWILGAMLPCCYPGQVSSRVQGIEGGVQTRMLVVL